MICRPGSQFINKRSVGSKRECLKPSYMICERCCVWLKGAKSGPALQFSTAVSCNRRLARDYERLPKTLAGLHYLAFAILMLKNFVCVMAHVI